jgi:hypothetical protein
MIPKATYSLVGMSETRGMLLDAQMLSALLSSYTMRFTLHKICRVTSARPDSNPIRSLMKGRMEIHIRCGRACMHACMHAWSGRVPPCERAASGGGRETGVGGTRSRRRCSPSTRACMHACIVIVHANPSL